MIQRRPGSSPACILGIHFYDEIGNAEYMHTERAEGTKEATVLDFRLRVMTLPGPALVFSLIRIGPKHHDGLQRIFPLRILRSTRPPPPARMNRWQR